MRNQHGKGREKQHEKQGEKQCEKRCEKQREKGPGKQREKLLVGLTLLLLLVSCGWFVPIGKSMGGGV